MWLVWNWKRCWATRLSDAQSMKCVPYWCNLYRKILALNGRCWISLDGVDFLVFFRVFGVVFFLNGGLDGDGLGVLNYFWNLWGGVGCDTGTIWYGERGDTGDTGTPWACTGRIICDRGSVGVTTGRTIVGFLVDLPRSYDILKSAYLVMSPYSSDGTTGGMLWRMGMISIYDWLR